MSTCRTDVSHIPDLVWLLIYAKKQNKKNQKKNKCD